MSKRLDEVLVAMGLASSRSQAANFIKMGYVSVAGKNVKKPGNLTRSDQKVKLHMKETYVSRAGYKLASAAKLLSLDFKGSIVLDVGSSTGGFTDFALQHGAANVIAVDVGTDQLHHSLHGNPKIELHEKTDIRDMKVLGKEPTHVVIDVSFISLREVLPHIASLVTPDAHIIAMVKPQFEAGSKLKTRGVIKNDTLRRQILKDFEAWAKQRFIISAKADSEVTGSKGNRERFYLLKKTAPRGART